MSADSYGEPFTVQRLRAMVATLPSNIREHSTTKWAADEIDSLRAELAALKARRCDGCVRWGAVYVSGPYAGMASCDGQPVDDCGCGAAPMTTPDHACNAWEARTDG